MKGIPPGEQMSFDDVRQREAIPTVRRKHTIYERYQEWRRTPAGMKVAAEAAERSLRAKRDLGFARWSIDGVVETIRWDRAVRVGKDEAGYKINNNYRALLAREIMETYPELDGFFEIRRRFTA